MIGVLTVDDDHRFLRLVRDIVLATPGFHAVGEASCGEDCVALVAALEPHLVLMDVRMPGIGGIEAARRIDGAARGRVAVVLMSADPPSLATATARAGAVGVVRKERLCPAALRALWEECTSRREALESAQGA